MLISSIPYLASCSCNSLIWFRNSSISTSQIVLRRFWGFGGIWWL
ncbi:hypothetical protein Patl1_33121 [Pistacia atlantica]|uniref:Uncharacterized protein n=1 Tax=Pistacia atlantica TaxID=434234 RepID=A0ACC1AQC3_9ROSI|nr:hypothetical protein Patl1_33121 [Pistacia atlantica]